MSEIRFCVDCKWHDTVWDEDVCRHPEAANIVNRSAPRCRDVRRIYVMSGDPGEPTGLCGYEGRLWERKA